MINWGTAKLYGSDSISFIQCSGIQTAMRSSISMTVFNPITVGIKDQQISKDQGISTNDCKDQGSTTFTTVKTKDKELERQRISK